MKTDPMLYARILREVHEAGLKARAAYHAALSAIGEPLDHDAHVWTARDATPDEHVWDWAKASAFPERWVAP